MKVVYLSGSCSGAGGGIFEVQRSVATALCNRHGVSIEAAGLLDEWTLRDQKAWDRTQVHCFPAVGPKQFGYSPESRDWLKASNHDLLHLHNLWMYLSVLALGFHTRTRRPYIVSPHGMLDPWAVQNSGWKKRLAGLIYENRMLSKAAVIHAFHQKDLKDIRSYGLKNPVAIIPNGVDFSQVAEFSGGTRELSSRSKRRILYLGRLHPKKGLIELIKAWGLLSLEQRSGWQITIAGWDDGGYLSALKQEVNQLGLQESIQFFGSAFGEAKAQLYRASDGFILPSKSEGLPMTVLEAWAYGKPVVMTSECNLPEGFEAGAALKIEPTPEQIAKGLRAFLALTDSQRVQMGFNGRGLVERQFTWDSVADQFMSVYRWMLGAGPQPECVHTVS